MKITSLEIKQHEFEKTFRGYNIEEVDIFLNNIANEWERISNEARMLRMQLEIAEKEAAKLREVEMSLIKTLQTAESTSNKIAEHAKLEADNQIQKARVEAEKITKSAEIEADIILSEARNQVSESHHLMIDKEKSIKQDIAGLTKYRAEILAQLKKLGQGTLRQANEFEDIRPANAIAEIPAEVETKMEVKAIASSANNMVLETEDSRQARSLLHKRDDLTLIEGIGPKISELLILRNIECFRDLIITPSYKIKEILQDAGGNFGLHDPSTWAQQARLAENNAWTELEELKAKLRGGREVSKAVVVEFDEPKVSSSEQVTEEMLDRVNKVKAALKKAMTVKDQDDIQGRSTDREQSSRSFFDNL